LFSPTLRQHNIKEGLATDLFERLNFEESFLKPFFKQFLLAKLHETNLYKVSRRRARDRDRNPSKPRPRRDLRPSRPRPSLETPSLVIVVPEFPPYYNETSTSK